MDYWKYSRISYLKNPRNLCCGYLFLGEMKKKKKKKKKTFIIYHTTSCWDPLHGGKFFLMTKSWGTNSVNIMRVLCIWVHHWYLFNNQIIHLIHGWILPFSMLLATVENVKLILVSFLVRNTAWHFKCQTLFSWKHNKNIWRTESEHG